MDLLRPLPAVPSLWQCHTLPASLSQPGWGPASFITGHQLHQRNKVRTVSCLCLQRILADGEGSQLLGLLRGRLGGLSSAGDMHACMA